jgi:hypothetical protein
MAHQHPLDIAMEDIGIAAVKFLGQRAAGALPRHQRSDLGV